MTDPTSALGETLRARYDDDRRITITQECNHEIAVRIGNQEPAYFDALDLLRAVSRVALDQVWGPSPTEGGAR